MAVCMDEPLIEIQTRRDDAFEHFAGMYSTVDAARAIRGISRVAFVGEPAVGPGVVVDWIGAVSGQFARIEAGLFFNGQEKPHYLRINPAGRSSRNWENSYRSVGRMLALSLIHEVPLGIDLPLHLYAKLLGERLTEEQVGTLEPNLISSFNQIRRMSDEELPYVPITINGVAHDVTRENMEVLFSRKIDSLIDHTMIDQYRMLAEGFYAMIPEGYLRGIVDAQSLKEIILGETIVDVDDMMAHVEYDPHGGAGWNSEHPTMQWFWRIVHEMDNEQRRRLLKFITGASTVPAGGFANLHQPIILFPTYQSPMHMPAAHTCFFQLDVPTNYPDIERMRERLLKALEVDYMGTL